MEPNSEPAERTMRVKIERARPEDAEAIVDVHAQTWLATYPNEELGITEEDIRHRIYGDHGERIPERIERYRRRLATEDERRSVFVARHSGRIVGLAAVVIEEDPDTKQPVHNLQALYVLPEAQRQGPQGAGPQLLQSALAWHGAHDVYLQVTTYNDHAIRFYQKNGFVMTNRPVTDKAVQPGDKELPQLEMVRRSPVEDATNDPTLRTYESTAERYMESARLLSAEDRARVMVWIDEVLRDLPTEASILELGSGPGQDAAYIESRGYRVHRTDAAAAFVTHLRSQGVEAEQLNPMTDELGGPWQLIFANSLFLHFTQPQLRDVLTRAYAALAPGGRLAFNLKLGQGNEWESRVLDSPRYFQYWTEDEILQELAALGFERTQVTPGDPIGVTHGQPSQWMNVVSHRRS